MKRTAVLFVCMGNICRSPLAEGIFAHLIAQRGIADRFVIDSAGTGGWHSGDAPDRRSVAVARDHSIDIAKQKARQVRPSDFKDFDLILAMDDDNLTSLQAICPQHCAKKLHLFANYATGVRSNVPDPYYGGQDGFQTVYTMLFSGCTSLIGKLETGQAS
ncbi:low molecular weight protein-tyrosine-phosphatase [Rhizobium skierniewicense]|uniref:low molecular weight protein-tyrosine-phosphatase n=1 Tax=Rhizobium skierniewicense TaxID=984260 RepID=UPI001573328E|nr:low molecular weight protein-tyrosine-phosphatase [Rhizobium skierniewicense]NTF33303.1 low molecular weight phosphotyrosine protein phosphatase [Rhizobium skierniewicense]